MFSKQTTILFPLLSPSKSFFQTNYYLLHLGKGFFCVVDVYGWDSLGPNRVVGFLQNKEDWRNNRVHYLMFQSVL